MPESNRRQTYRIVYPRDAFPTFDWAGEPARVIDCSERGFRVEVPLVHELPVEEHSLFGRIRFPDGSSVQVCGVVRHVRGRVVGVHCDEPGVPWRVMLREQLRLRTGKRERAETVVVYRRR
jgi:PilZ domain-containing protein